MAIVNTMSEYLRLTNRNVHTGRGGVPCRRWLPNCAHLCHRSLHLLLQYRFLHFPTNFYKLNCGLGLLLLHFILLPHNIIIIHSPQSQRQANLSMFSGITTSAWSTMTRSAVFRLQTFILNTSIIIIPLVTLNNIAML